MALTSAQRVELIQKMYVAYYGRPADTGGLDNWINHLVQHNDDASAIIQAFGTSPEATSLYGEPVNYALAVNALYMQMFNRPAEPDGLALYVAHLNAGRVTLPNLALTIATGAQNADRDTFLNKVEVATAFTAEVATSTENILGYAGEDAAAHAAAFLAGVDNTDASVTAALADLESTIDTIIGLDQLSSLPTHTLTTGLDNLLGTNGNDVVLANLTAGPNGEEVTLELDDAFNALLGQDTLRLDAWGQGPTIDVNQSVLDDLEEQVVLAEYALTAAQYADEQNSGTPAEEAAEALAIANAHQVLVEAEAALRNYEDLTSQNGANVTFDSTDYHMTGFERVLVQARNDEELNLTLDLLDMAGVDLEVRNMIGTDGDGFAGDSDLNAYNIEGDVLVVNAQLDEIQIDYVGGDVSLREIEFDNEVRIYSVGGSVSIDGIDGYDWFEDGESDTYITDISGDLTINNADLDWVEVNGVSGDVTMTNFDANDNVNLFNIGGDITLTEVDANDNLNVIFASDVAHGTINLENVSVDTELHINGADAVAANGEVTTVAGSLTSVTLNVSGEYGFDAHGIELTSYEDESDEQSNITSLTINANGDVTLDYIDLALDSEDNAVTTSLTINGAGDVDLGDLGVNGNTDDAVNIVYTGSGSLNIEMADPVVGSFNASTATGDVTFEVDLSNADLDFTYAGSRGADRVIIGEDSLGSAAVDEDTVRLSLAGGIGVDTMVVADDSDLSEEAMALVSGFEVLEIDLYEAYGDSIDDLNTFNLIDTHNDFTSVVLARGVGQDLHLLNLSATQAQNISILASDENCNALEDLLVTLEDATGSEDRVALSLVASNENFNDFNNNFIDDQLILDDIEHLTINATGDEYYVETSYDDDTYAYGDINLDDRIEIEMEDINANELRTLTINGDVDLNIDSISSQDLRQIDARNFNGEFLALGWGEGIYTDDDIEILGAAETSHDINVNGNEDVTVVTGNGDDNINVYAGGDVVITTGNGVKDIYVDSAYDYSVDDVTITTGTGNDEIDVEDGVDVTITSGAGEDDIDFDETDITGAVVINAGVGADTIRVSANTTASSITVTTGAGVDNVVINDSRYETNGSSDEVVVTDFTAGADGDVLKLDITNGDISFATTLERDGDYSFTSVAANTTAILEFGFDATNDGANLATTYADNGTVTGAQLLSAVGDAASSLVTINDGTDGYIVAYSGGKGFLFNFTDDANEAHTLSNGTQGDIITYVEDSDGDDIAFGSNVHEVWTLDLSSNGENYDAGDTFVIKGLNTSGVVDLTYTVSATNQSATAIAAAIQAELAATKAFDVTVSGGDSTVLVFTADTYGNKDNVIEVIYTQANNLDASDIQLIGVLDNVAVGSLVEGNFGLI